MIAEPARRRGDLGNAFNFQSIWDQQMPSSTGSIIYGQVTVTNGSTAVTGLNTNFTTASSTGTSLANQYLIFGNDATKTPYKVNSVSDNFDLVLASSYTGATATTSARLVTICPNQASGSSGSATVTITIAGSNLVVGQWLTFANDPTSTAYQIQSLGTSNLVLTAPLATGFSAYTAQNVTVLSYTCLALHEYAIALALRPIATPDEARNVVDVSYIDLQGIPLRVMVSYVHIYQALFVTVDFGYALGVIRPDFGVIIQA